MLPISQAVILNFFIITWAGCLSRVVFCNCLRSWQCCVSPQQDSWQEGENSSLVSSCKVHSSACGCPFLTAEVGIAMATLQETIAALRTSVSLLGAALALARTGTSAFPGAQSQCGQWNGNVWVQLWLSSCRPSHRVIPVQLEQAVEWQEDWAWVEGSADGRKQAAWP